MKEQHKLIFARYFSWIY